MKDSRIRQSLLDLEGSIRRVIYSKNSTFTLIRLVFLKYCVDNSIGAETKEDFQYCMNAQKVFTKRDVESGIDFIVPVLRYLDRAYKLDGLLSSLENIDAYSNDLGFDSISQRKGMTSSDFRMLLDKLAECDFDEHLDSKYSVGQQLVDELIWLFNLRSRRSSIASEVSTSTSLARLVKEILDVKETDTFCDFVSGLGISSITITKDAMPTVKNVEVIPSVASLSAMLYIMYGYKDFSITCGDSLSGVLNVPKADKVFVDPPLGLRVARVGEDTKWEACNIAIDIVLHDCLNANGLAVIAVPGSVLFQSISRVKSLKSEMVELGLLKAVIALPSMWQGTNIGTNLLVINKNVNKDILFIDASQEITVIDKEENLYITTDSNTVRKRIAGLIKSPRNEEGFSQVVPISKVAEKEYSLVPAQYIPKFEAEEKLTVKDIDDQLQALYKQLLS